MKKAIVLCGLAFLVASLVGTADKAEARPQYLKQFAAQYPEVADKAKEAKCGICHPEKDKKIRNDYAKAVGTSLGKDDEGKPVKNEKDVAKIEAAFKKAGEMKPKGGEKTYDAIIKGGELPE